MPTYQYKCKECGEEFEYLQSMSDSPLTEWPSDVPRKCNCNAGVSKKIGLGGGVILKGTGFYETDYVKKSGGGSTSSSVNTDKPSNTNTNTTTPTSTSKSKESNKTEVA